MKPVIGKGAIDRLGELVAARASGIVLIVSDAGVAAAGIVERAIASLERANLQPVAFTDVGQNPTTEHVAAGVAKARSAGSVELIIGLGGGSAMDCAKGINFLLTNGGHMADYRGDGLAKRPMLPSIGIPTTAGTGSETQRYALITDADTKQKMACGDEKARFAEVILDPVLLVSVPASVAAASAVDAVSHAVESYVSTPATPASRLLARQALTTLALGLGHDADPPIGDSRSRQRLLLGAHWAGAAIERSMLGAAHACANPLTARYGIVHGVAVGLMLPHVIDFNDSSVGTDYRDLRALAIGDRDMPLAQWIAELTNRLGLPARLTDLGIERSQLATLAIEAATQKTAPFNPRPLDVDALRTIYEAAY